MNPALCMRALVLIGALTVGTAHAGDTAARRMLPMHEQLEWRGVGRLNFEDGGYCTATLLSETLVVTAAHCLFADARRRRDSEVWFAAGYRNGKWQAIRQARRTAVHPDYVSTPGTQANADQTVADIALIELDAPVMDTTIPHYPAADLPDPGGGVALLSYGRGRSDALSLQEPCRVIGRWKSIVRLTCEVAQGSSGAPVFRRGLNGAPQMVAVISGYTSKETFAVALDTGLPPLRAALEGQGPRRKTVGTGVARPRAPGAAAASTAPRLQGGGAWQPKRPPDG
jgi:protease YdgD